MLWYWAGVVDPIDQRVEEFRSDVLSLFTAQQRDVVNRYISLFLHLELEGEDDRSLERAGRAIWGAT